jgi:hypothetical protein
MKLMPLLTEVEAGEVYRMSLEMGAHERRSWGPNTRHAEVAVLDERRGGASRQALDEWARQHPFPSRASEYGRGLGDEKVLSHREAKAIIRQEDREIGRASPTRSRPR